jgi:Leucine-rich repeat (LRR) protein
MITKIDLSGFAEVSRSGIKELLESIEQLPCLKSLSLRNNRINDEYSNEILSIFDNKSITTIDLSQNFMKKLGMDIGKKLKDECSHVTWIDLTQNDFDYDLATVAMIINGLKKQKDLIYIGLSCQDK